jgi:hypothetical protein
MIQGGIMPKKLLLACLASMLFLAFAGCDDGFLSSGGSINVSSDPTGAEIYLDGSSTGETTNTMLTKISEGSHTIKLILSGYEDTEKTVEVAVDDTVYVGLPLTEDAGDPGPVSVDVTGRIVLGDWFAYYTYKFNQDVTATNGELTMPGRSTITIKYIYGAMEGNRTYCVIPICLDVDEYYQPKTQIPRGTHILYFEGISASGESFTLTEEIPLN